MSPRPITRLWLPHIDALRELLKLAATLQPLRFQPHWSPTEVISVAGNMRLTFFSPDLWHFFGNNGGAGGIRHPAVNQSASHSAPRSLPKKNRAAFLFKTHLNKCFFPVVQRMCGGHWCEAPAGCVPVCTGC